MIPFGFGFRFAATRPGETTVDGTERPGYSSKLVGLDRVQAWIAFMRAKGIHRVCCLLPSEQRAYYTCDLLGEYRAGFGADNVCTAEVRDYHLCESDVLESRILPFLVESDDSRKPVVVHCSGGSGRTGHVLAAWLVRRRGLSVDEALTAVEATDRKPREAVENGNATEEQLRQLLAGQYS